MWNFLAVFVTAVSLISWNCFNFHNLVEFNIWIASMSFKMSNFRPQILCRRPGNHV